MKVVCAHNIRLTPRASCELLPVYIVNRQVMLIDGSLRVRVAELLGKGEIAPLAKHGEIGNGRKNESRDDNIRSTHYGTDTEYTLRQPVELLSCCRLQSIPHSDGLLPCCFSLQSCDSGLCVSGPAAAGVLIFVCGVISSICSASIKSVSI